MPIHRTETDEFGNKYKIVSSLWLNIITGLVIFGTALLLIAFVILIDQYRAIEEFRYFNEVTKQRRQAFDEMLTNRQRLQKWTFDRACEYAKSKGDSCLDNPQWWADPNKYPLLVGEDGTGLVPPTKVNQYR